jgi:hypothetical protein
MTTISDTAVRRNVAADHPVSSADDQLHVRPDTAVVLTRLRAEAVRLVTVRTRPKPTQKIIADHRPERAQYIHD